MFLGIIILKIQVSYEINKNQKVSIVLPAKSDSDVMPCYKVIRYL